MLRVILILILNSLFHVRAKELFTATEDLKVLTSNYQLLVQEVQSYVQKPYRSSEYLEKKLTFLERELSIMQSDIDAYIFNPLNAFLLIKRLTNDTLLIIERINDYEFTEKVIHLIPDLEELSGVVEGIARLQVTYDLKSEDLSNGIINGVKYREEMNSHDLYVLADELLMALKPKLSIEYIIEALLRINRNDNLNEISRYDLMFLLALAYYDDGNLSEALKIIEELEKISSKDVFKLDELKSDIMNIHLNQTNQEHMHFPEYDFELSELELTSKVCRGVFKQTSAETSKLFCRYISKSDFSKIAPFKLEEFSINPYIVLYHEVMSSNEIEILKNMSRPLFERSVVFVGDDQLPASTRISKVAWFQDEDHEIIERISKRIEDMTGLTTKTAEDLQIQQYGFAGHYFNHYDFHSSSDDEEYVLDNRIATVMFYLKNVEIGGETAFPYINIKISPVQGSAAFWYNLHSSLELNFKTRHTGCPVLIGNKWVANKWLSTIGQEFDKPCEMYRTRGDEMKDIFEYLAGIDDLFD